MLPRRSLFAFHLVLSRTPSRSPTKEALRGASGVGSTSTTPRGSNTLCRPPRSCSLNARPPPLDGARAVRAQRAARRVPSVERSQHGRAHVAPARDEGREAAGVPARDEEVDVVGARDDGDAGIEVAPVPDRQGAVVHL